MMNLATPHRAIVLCLLTAEAWIALAAFDLARPGGFARLCARLRDCRPSSRRGIASPADIVWAVEEACVWYVKRAACLQRSYVATRLLRRHGFAAEMVIGCRPLPFESHAWVEVGGRVVNDLPQYQRAFTVLNRL
jgi:transglutaminase superfamily protein